MNDLASEAKADFVREHRERVSKLTANSFVERDLILNLDGAETEHKATIWFDYTPSEPRAWDYPGYPAQAEITHVMIGETDIVDLICREAIKELEWQLAEGKS